MTEKQRTVAADVLRSIASLPVEERVEVVSTVIQVFAQYGGLVRASERVSAAARVSP